MVVLSTVTVDVNAPAVMSTEVGFNPHVTGLVALAGLVVIAQVKSTVPVNASEGVTVMIDVLPVVAPCVTVIAPLSLMLKLGPALMVTATSVLSEMLPDVPVTEKV